jgi:O-antigen/teichoic acid export membrane protein
LSTIPEQIDPLDGAASSPAAAARLARATAIHDNDSHARHRAHRSRRLRLSIFTSLLIKPLAFVIPIVTIPLFLRYLGSTERYGLYEAVGAVAMWLGMMNLGMGMGLVNQLTQCDVRGDRARARLYVSTLSWTMIGLFLIGVLGVVVATFAVDWVAVFNITERAARAEVRWSVLAAGVLTLVGLLTGTTSAVYMGYQELHRNNYWDGATKVSVLVACVALVYLPGLRGLGVVGVLLAVSGLPALLRLVNTFTMFWYEKPWLRPSPRLFDTAALRVLLGHGLYVFVLQMSVMAMFQADKLIIGTAIGADAVAPYAILGRLFISAYGVFMLILTPLWAAYGDAIGRGDTGWVLRQIGRTRLFGCGLMLACGAFMLVAGEHVLALLSRGGTSITVSRGLVVAFTAAFVVRAWVDSQSIALNAASVFRPQVLIYGGHALLSFVVAVLLVRPFGVEGVAWAAPLTGLVTSVWGYPWMIRKYIIGAHGRAPGGAPVPTGAEPAVAAAAAATTATGTTKAAATTSEFPS